MRNWLVCVVLCFSGALSFSTFRNLHTLMTRDELVHFFGVESPFDIVSDQYELVRIQRHGRAKPFDYRQLLEVDASADSRSLNGDRVRFDFDAYGKSYSLKLKVNDDLVAAGMKIVKRGDTGDSIAVDSVSGNCHFVSDGGDIIAALSHCQQNNVRGYILDGTKSFEVQPLTPRLRTMLSSQIVVESPLNWTFSGQETYDIGPHIIRLVDTQLDFTQFADTVPWIVESNVTAASSCGALKPPISSKRKPRRRESRGVGLASKITSTENRAKTLELGLFLDEAAYRIYMPYLNYNEKAFIDLILAFVNGMQALYHLPSLGTRLTLTIVNIEIMAKQPQDLPTFGGERGPLLNSFCQYNRKVNPPGDNTSGHWDIGLYISGLDFYALQNGRKNFITMGLSTVTGVCTEDFSCVIGEFGVVNQRGQLYPSTGFTAIYVMAHEIGHNLGMFHDSTNNKCPPHGYIMSPSRGTSGETKWSTCSAATLSSLSEPCLDNFPAAKIPIYDHSKYKEKPGQIWTADDQCRLLLKDRSAGLFSNGPLRDICESLKCKTPSRDGIFFAGPALEGTACGDGYWCSEGDCVRVPVIDVTEDLAAGWSAWKTGTCTSSCLIKSKGTLTNRRDCLNRDTNSSIPACDGLDEHVDLCDDTQICRRRMSVVQYATNQCRKLSKSITSLDRDGPGVQLSYSASRRWQSCAIYCKKADSDIWYSPQLEVNDIDGTDGVHFPDGTWCHNDGTVDYYCKENLCLPQAS